MEMRLATGLSVDGAMVDGGCSGRETLQSFEGPGCWEYGSNYRVLFRV